MPPQANVKAEGNATEEAVEPVTKSSSDADISAGVPKKKMQTLAERNRIPPSFFLTSLIILMFQYYGGIYRMDTIYSWKSSIVTSYFTSIDKMRYLKDLMQATVNGEIHKPKEYAIALITTLCIASILYVLIWSPLRAGMWTGTRARRHKVHRYLGLLYLIQYASAWTEYLTNYENGMNSFLPYFIVLNGRSWMFPGNDASS